MFRFFLLVVIAALPLLATSQKMKWGKVSEKDLAMSVYPADSSAAAAVLGDYGYVSFDITLDGIFQRYERHRRIKILNQAGYDYANVRIARWKEYEKFLELKAQIHLPNGEKIKLRNSDFFTEDRNDDVEVTKFTFPQLTEGAIIEYSYIIQDETFTSLPEWYFQEAIPVRYSEYRTFIPEWFQYVSVSQSPATYTTRESEVEARTVNLPSRTSDYRREGRLTVTTDLSGMANNRIQVNFNRTRLAMKDVPAYREEPYMTAIDDFLPQVNMQLATIKWPNATPKNQLNSWEALAKELLEFDGFGAQYLRKGKHKNLSATFAPILAEVETPAEKVERIYSELNRRVRWDGTHRLFTNSSLDKVLTNGEGNTAELNLMLLALLGDAGIEAYPVLLSTRDNGRINEYYPLVNQFDHFMVLANLGEEAGGFVWLDAGNPARPIGLPRVDALNHRGWLVDETVQQFVDIIAPASKQATIGLMTLDPSGKLSGTINCKMEGYSAVNGLVGLAQETEEDRPMVSQLMRQYPEARISNFSAEPEAGTLQVSADCIIPAAEVIDDYMYIRPLLLPMIEQELFALAKREYPVDIPYGTSERFVLQLTVPENYAVEELPASQKVSLTEDGAVTFNYSVNPVGSLLVINIAFDFGRLLFAPEEYEYLKSFIDQIIELQESQIVLRKKT